ncbi:MAG: 1-acyl-sn-glycerol-3-phosphate acyltransferase [Mycobacteriaceae bacterium]
MTTQFRVRGAIARTVLRAVRWKTVGTLPQEGILVGAPHTSNWDWVATILMCWTCGVQPLILVKKEFFTGPFGPILRATGGVPLDRKDPGGTIRELLAQAESDDSFLLTIAAEGTRSKGEYWKSGFYRMSQQTGLAVTLAFVDGPSRTIGAGPTFHPTGDIKKDMDFVRSFYADKHGINPDNRTEPRLREEEEAAE